MSDTASSAAATTASPSASGTAAYAPVGLSAREFVERQRSRSALAQFICVAAIISGTGLWLAGLLAQSWLILSGAIGIGALTLVALLVIRRLESDHSPLVRHHTAVAFNAMLSYLGIALVGMGVVAAASYFVQDAATSAPLDIFDLAGVAWLLALGTIALISAVRAFMAATGGQPFRYPLALNLLK